MICASALSKTMQYLNGADHTPQSIKNFINIIASKNDLLYKALQIKSERQRYCKMDKYLVARMNQVKPRTFEQIADIWYAGSPSGRNYYYHTSRYHFLNLHSFFTGNYTVELRGYNSVLHAGKVRAYIVLSLALNNQALTQRNASCRKIQEENPRFAMRIYLNRIGLIGEEFKSCREHLCEALDGSEREILGRLRGLSEVIPKGVYPAQMGRKICEGYGLHHELRQHQRSRFRHQAWTALSRSWWGKGKTEISILTPQHSIPSAMTGFWY